MRAPTAPQEERPRAVADKGQIGEFVIEPGGQDEPPIGAEVRHETVRWDLVLAFVLRLIALIWLAKGVAHWAVILGFGDLPLTEERRLRQALIVGFAVLDCAAAVGVWLLTPWGKSLWLFLALVEIALGASGFVNLFSFGTVIGNLILLAMFFVLAFTVRRARL